MRVLVLKVMPSKLHEDSGGNLQTFTKFQFHRFHRRDAVLDSLFHIYTKSRRDFQILDGIKSLRKLRLHRLVSMH